MADKRQTNTTGDEQGRVMPSAPELERAVAGAVMLEAHAYEQASEIISPDAFYDDRYKKVYTAAKELYDRSEPIDMLTVANRMEKNGTLKDVGGPAFVMELSANITSAAHIKAHAAIIAEKYKARQLIEVSSKALNDAFDPTCDPYKTVISTEQGIWDLLEQGNSSGPVRLDTQMMGVMEEIQTAIANGGGVSGLSSGFHSLDQMTTGWHDGEFHIIAARPAMGKTAFVLTMAKNMAIDMKIPVAVFSLEMTCSQLIKRLLANVCEVEGRKLRSGDLTEDEMTRLNRRSAPLYDAPLYIDETPALSSSEMRIRARRLVSTYGVKIIIVDYLQLMQPSTMEKGRSREQEVASVAKSLQALAKELHVPVIALAQLSRNSERREDKHPVLSDLRESGEIEQSADFVAFLHRPEYYLTNEKDISAHPELQGVAEVIIAKNRHGALGPLKMHFTAQYVRFEDSPERPTNFAAPSSDATSNDVPF